LLWGGRKITSVIDDVGSTPFYAYDRQKITNRVEKLRSVLPTAISIHYAVKANPMPAIIRHMLELVDGLDVASVGELLVALQCGANPESISFAGPGKRDSELQEALLAGVTVNLESETEMRRLAALADAHGVRPNVAIRVNPAFALKTSGMKMGGVPSPFGVDAERVPAMLSELASLDFAFKGFHIYSGSQNLRADFLVESISKTVQLVIELAEESSLDVSYVNLGGGLGIPYFPNEKPLDLNELAAPMAKAADQLNEAFDSPEIVLELGRFLVGEAGIYVTTVIDIKESRGIRSVVCDGGLHHHLAASGNFGQVLRKNYPILTSHAVAEQKLTKVDVVGPLCTPLDLLGKGVLLPECSVGDHIIIMQSGAYGATASPINFLSQPMFREILL
jgi:diaminopimelate decarboxylase